MLVGPDQYARISLVFRDGFGLLNVEDHERHVRGRECGGEISRLRRRIANAQQRVAGSELVEQRRPAGALEVWGAHAGT